MYKIVAIDLDDTLFDNNKKISEENKKAIQKCTELGVKIVIATGRPLIGAKVVLRELGLLNTDTYLICFNGALVYSLSDETVIYKAFLTGKDIKNVYQESLRLGVNYHAYDGKQKLITPKLSKYTEYGAKINKITAHVIDINTLLDKDEFIKCMMVDEEDKIINAINNLSDEFYNNYAVFRSAPFYLEFLNRNATKGKALLFLADYLNISQSDTIAIGDSENDLSMIEAAGLGIAMENSYPHVKEKADFVTKTNEENGVSYALDKFIIKTSSRLA